MQAIHLNNNGFTEVMGLIVSALKEREYDPYSQIYGYLKEKEPTYITSYNNARTLIQQLDKEEIIQYINSTKLLQFFN